MPDREPNWFGFGSGAFGERPAAAAKPAKQPIPSSLKPGVVSDFLGSLTQGDSNNEAPVPPGPAIATEAAHDQTEPEDTPIDAHGEDVTDQSDSNAGEEIPPTIPGNAGGPALEDSDEDAQFDHAPISAPSFATGSVSPLPDNPFEHVEDEGAIAAPPTTTHEEAHPASDGEAHACSRVSPPHLDPLFSALAVQGAFRGEESLAAHFHDCRTGLLLHLRAESGPSIPWKGRDEEPAKAGRKRWSYGPMRILDDTFYDTVKRKRNILAPALAINEMPAPKGNGPDATYIRALETPDEGSKAIALMITSLGQLLYANMVVDFKAGTFVVKPGVNGSDRLA